MAKPSPGQGWVRPALLAAVVLAGLALAARSWGGDLDWRSAAAALPAQFACGAQRRSDQLLFSRHTAVPPSNPDGYAPPVPVPGLTVDSSVLWDRQYLLDGPELERGITFGDSQRLRRQVARLMAGERVRVAAVGASITSGAGGREWTGTRTNWPGYASQFSDWLRAAFPRANATVHNAGMAGTFSGVFAQCFDTLIPPADIYILEQTTFDGTEPEKCYCKDHYVPTPVQLGIERLIRRMLKQAHQPAVIMLNVYGFRFPNREKYQRSVENQVQVMAQFYGLPTASLRAAAWRRMVEGGSSGFDVTTSVKLYNGKPLPPGNLPLYYDQIHPWGPTGHRVLADLLARTIQATAAGLAVQPLLGGELVPDVQALVPPMTAANYETNTSTCWLGDSFHGLVASAAGGAAQGFAWINERPDATDAKAQKWGYVATAPGARLEFTIDTRIASSQEDYNRVVLTYLASYDGMGVAHVECTQGCTCEPRDIDALWQEKASMLMTAEFAATQHEACHVRVTVRDKSSGSGHKFKLAGVMVLPAGTNEFSSSDRLEVVVPQMFEGGKGEPTVARVKPAAGP